jgi:hypothetical protein
MPVQRGTELQRQKEFGGRVHKRKEALAMKTMTCKQLGGPCEFPLRGATADEIIKAQDAHLKTSVAEGDDTHSEALKDMKGRWKHPIAGMGWYKKTKRDFADLSED